MKVGQQRHIVADKDFTVSINTQNIFWKVQNQTISIEMG